MWSPIFLFVCSFLSRWCYDSTSSDRSSREPKEQKRIVDVIPLKLKCKTEESIIKNKTRKRERLHPALKDQIVYGEGGFFFLFFLNI